MGWPDGDGRDRRRSLCPRGRAGLLALGVLAAGVGGCGSTMMIHTRPADATVLVDGREIGRSPVLYHGRSAWNEGVEVRARLEGYQEAVLTVPRAPSPHHLAESVLFPPAAAWGWYLPDRVTLFLDPTSPGSR